MNTILVLFSLWAIPMGVGLVLFITVLWLIRRSGQPAVAVPDGVDGESSTRMPVLLAALLAYAFGIFSGLLLFLLEKKNPYVSFHGAQSMLLFGGLLLVESVAGFLPVIGFFVATGLTTLGWFLWIYMMVGCYRGTRISLPLVGAAAERLSDKRLHA